MEHINWGLSVSVYLFMAGMGAASFLVAVIADLAGGERYARVRFAGSLIAPWPVMAGMLLLAAELGSPSRFWEMVLRRGEGFSLAPPYIMLNPGSPMSLGTWFLNIFVALSLIYLILTLLSKAIPWKTPAIKAVGLITIPFALLAMGSLDG